MNVVMVLQDATEMPYVKTLKAVTAAYASLAFLVLMAKTVVSKASLFGTIFSSKVGLDDLGLVRRVNSQDLSCTIKSLSKFLIPT